MKWIIRLLKLIPAILVALILFYYLPGTDIVRVTGIEVSRQDFRKMDQTPTGQNRDVSYIYSEWPNEKVRVYRNEDAPLYLKFDSENLNAQAQSLGNRFADAEIWMAVKHYGWRIPVLSWFPNAISMKQVPGPDTRIIPWFNIIFLTLLGLLILRIWLWMRGVKKKHVDPIGDKIEDVTEAAGEEIKEKRSAIRGLMRRWFGSSGK